MELLIRDAHPDDAAGIVSIFNLFGATFEAARRKGYEKIFTYIRADNPVALTTYQTQGFQVIGKANRHANVQGRYVDVLIVERPL